MSRLARLLWVMFAGYWLVLLTLTHLPARRLPHVKVSDKTAHVIAYGLWAALGMAALWKTWPSRRWAPLLVIPAGMLVGALDEWTQPWTGRTCDFYDWVGDMAGVSAVLLTFIAIRCVRAKKSEDA